MSRFCETDVQRSRPAAGAARPFAGHQPRKLHELLGTRKSSEIPDIGNHLYQLRFQLQDTPVVQIHHVFQRLMGRFLVLQPPAILQRPVLPL